MRITAPAALLVLGLAVIIGALIALGKDPAILIGFINTVGLALVYAQNEAIKQQTNGTTHRMMSIVEKATVPQGTVDNGQSTQDTTKTQAA